MDTSIKPIQFYQRMGFVIESTKKLNFEHIKDDMRGMVVMKKNLWNLNIAHKKVFNVILGIVKN